ncbi:MAG TPA: hypothetical protein PLX89_22745 [Verrucomicrobiota bacterium]|nr:hypothetical protein [Verrucomicrobiota bacterium]
MFAYGGKQDVKSAATMMLSGDPGFGATANGFGFLISWATNAAVVVKANPSLAAPVWTPVSTNTLTDYQSLRKCIQRLRAVGCESYGVRRQAKRDSALEWRETPRFCDE